MCTAGVGWQEEDEVDYDLDEQDRQWLAAFNRGQERLPYRRMELLLWRLDTANAEATDSAFLSKTTRQPLCSAANATPVCTLMLHIQLSTSSYWYMIHVPDIQYAAKSCRATSLHTSQCDASPAHTSTASFAADAGASVAERTSPAACATTDHMTKEQAMEALTHVAAVRQRVKDALYQYWLDKRKQLGKPLLRRLQAPTNSSDTNPHSCFR